MDSHRRRYRQSESGDHCLLADTDRRSGRVQGMGRTSDQKEVLFSNTNRLISGHIVHTEFLAHQHHRALPGCGGRGRSHWVIISLHYAIYFVVRHQLIHNKIRGIT